MKRLNYRDELAAGRIQPVNYAIPDTFEGVSKHPRDQITESTKTFDPRYGNEYRIVYNKEIIS